MVWFSNRAGSVDTFAGTSAISYEVQCNDLPSGGVDRTAVNNLAAKYVSIHSRFRNFRENFIVLKDISDVKFVTKADLPISINNSHFAIL